MDLDRFSTSYSIDRPGADRQLHLPLNLGLPMALVTSVAGNAHNPGRIRLRAMPTTYPWSLRLRVIPTPNPLNQSYPSPPD